MSGSSDYTQTPNLLLYKPISNRAIGTWGDLWNSNADKLDTALGTGAGGVFLPITGGTMTGAVALAGISTAPTAVPGTNTLQLANTAFVAALVASQGGVTSFNTRAGVVTLTSADLTAAGGALLASVPQPSSTTPVMDGTAAVGTGTTWARADHVHASDTSRYAASNPSGYQTAAQVSATAATYLPLAGGNLTGNLSVNSGVVAAWQSGGQAPTFACCNSGGTSTGGMAQVGGNLTLYVTSGGATITLGTSNNMVFSGATASKPGGGAWGDSSDARIKDVLGDYAAGLAEITALRPVRYRYKGNDAASKEAVSPHALVLDRDFVGLVAQEAETVMPELVTQGDGFVDGAAVNDLRSLDATALTFALVNAVRELAASVAALEATPSTGKA
jgi:hypothetical protein